MMSPKNERLRMIEAVVQAAASLLDEPIDRIEIIGTRAQVRAGRHVMAFELTHGGGGERDGAVILGSGGWYAHAVPPDDGGWPPARPQPWWRRWWARLQ